MLVRRRHLPILAALVWPATPALAQTEDTGGSGGHEAGELVPMASRTSVLGGETVSMSGNVGVAHAGRTVRIERRERPERWRPVTTAVADQNGAFTARWRTGSPGRYALRVVVEPERGTATTAAIDNDFFTRISVFRSAVASWYGPGFFGRSLACGGRLRRGTIGVAHKTLPCGTRLDLLYAGQTMAVEVIDRGPYIAGREFDLTQATAEALGFSEVGPIGVLRARRAAARRP